MITGEELVGKFQNKRKIYWIKWKEIKRRKKRKGRKKEGNFFLDVINKFPQYRKSIFDLYDACQMKSRIMIF